MTDEERLKHMESEHARHSRGLLTEAATLDAVAVQRKLELLGEIAKEVKKLRKKLEKKK